MKALLAMVCVLFASGTFAADCVTNSQGKTVCSNGEKAVVVNKNTGTVKSAERNSGGATTVQSRNGTKAAYNPRTGNAAVSQTNQNGVTTTKTAGGSEVKSKNGVGMAKAPDGTTCVKGKNNQGCTKN